MFVEDVFVEVHVAAVVAVVVRVAGRRHGVGGACWLPPVDAPVVDPFRPPPCTWCAGNRGLEYGTPSGVAVRAVAAGEVTFSGTVAGERYVVVRHADGRRATYGGLASFDRCAPAMRWRRACIVGDHRRSPALRPPRRRHLRRPGPVPRPSRRPSSTGARRRHRRPSRPAALDCAAGDAARRRSGRRFVPLPT